MKKTMTAFVILSALVLSGCVVGVSSVQPPHARYYGHPSLVVIPGTYVYAMADVDDDIYFHVGWWWRQWDGRWYTSRHHDHGWNHYRGVPAFYREVDPRWREYYRHRRWHGHPWACERIPASRVQQDWHRWQNTRHWEREKNWGVQGFRPEPYRQARLTEPQRDRHEDWKPHSRREDRRFGNGSESNRRREFAREQEGSRNGRPYFGNLRTDGETAHGRENQHGRQGGSFKQVRGDDVNSERQADEHIRRRQDRRPTQSIFDRPRRNSAGSTEQSEPQSLHRNRDFFGQERGKPEGMKQQRREQFRQRRESGNASPVSRERQRETHSEQVQRDESGSRLPRFERREREVGQERNRETLNRRRPPRDRSQTESIADDPPSIPQAQ
jgi:hypothetical protein